MDTICRICLKSLNNKQTISIYRNYADDTEIYLKIMDISGIVITPNDKILPNSICLECYENLSSSYEFRNLCRNSDIKLKNEVTIVKDEPLIIPNEYESYSETYSEDEPSYTEKFKTKGDETISEAAATTAENSEKILTQPADIVDLKSIFNLIPGSKNRYICKICGGKISIRRGKYNFNRHLETNKHRSQLSTNEEHIKEMNKTEDSSHEEIQQTKLKRRLTKKVKYDEKCIGVVSNSEDNLSISFEENSNTIAEKRNTPIERLTETATTSKSKRRNTYFNSKLQDEFRADFEPDEKSKFKAFCKTCKRTISIKSSGRSDLIQHMNTYRHKGIKLIRLKTGGRTVDDMLLLSQEQLFICEICGNVYNKKYQLRRHIASHNETYSFSCEICQKKFRQSSHIKRHMRVHTGEKPYQCRFCGRCFGDMSTKVKHERTHTDERPYPCNTCDKRFRNASTRNEHLRIHTGEKPFSCETCNVAFTKKCQLVTHYKSKTHQNLLLV